MRRPFFTRFLIMFSLAFASIGSAVAGKEKASGDSPILARKISAFTLKDFRGKTHALADYAESKAIVIYFMGTECPLAKLYGPRVQKLAREFASRGVAVLGINSNSQDSITELAAYARIHEIDFPILKDLGNKIADRFGATRTPQVFLLDQDRVIRYYGRIDAQFTFGSGVGLARPQPKRNDLQIAIGELLSGKSISKPITEVKGCLIGRVRKPRADSKVTYSNQISRLIQQHCLECHRPGQIAPFAMTDYDEVAGWGEMMAEVVRQQRMPPWHADAPPGHFANANLLTKAEKELIYEWVENGCPEGDPKDLPAPRKFRSNWFTKDEPDLIVRLPAKQKIKAAGVESYRYIEVDPQIKEDKWVKISECMPGNRAVVHHIIVFVRPPGPKPKPGERRRNRSFFLAGFAPGTRPLVAPDGWARRVPAGSKFIFEMHYTPIGSPQTDLSSVGLTFMNAKDVTHRIYTRHAWNRDLELVPFEKNQKVTSTGRFDKQVILLSMFPHMHMRGKSFRYELVPPDKSEKKTLLFVPEYDFNWQTSYVLKKPLVIPAGSELQCTAFYDNSEDNLANPNPSLPVRWGEQTWDEMMIGWYDIGIPVRKPASK